MNRRLLALLGCAALLVPSAGLAQEQPQAAQDQSQKDKASGEQAVKREEVVVVTASKVEQKVVDAPATVTVVTPEVIASSPAQNFGDLLRSVPGLNVVQTSARDINMTSRQATSTLVNSQLVLLDGRSVYLDFFGLVLWDFIPADPNEIKQIEVVRGPASVVWGANALTGVVNILTKTPREQPGFTLGATGGLLERECDRCSQTGTGTSYGANLTYAAAPNDTWSYKIAGGYYSSDPLSRPTGQIPVATDPRDPTGRTTIGGGFYPGDASPGAGQFGTRFQNTGTSQPRVTLRVDQELANGGSISYSGGYSGTEGIVHTGVGPFDIQSGSYLVFGKLGYTKGALKIGAFANLTDAEAPNLLSPDPLTLRPLQLNFKTQTFDFEVGHSKVFGGRHLLSYGGNARRNNFDITIAPEAEDRNEFGAYVQEEFFVEKVRIAAGVRVDKFGNLDDPVFSPRVNVMFKPRPEHSIRASFNRAFRSPSTINNFLNIQIFAPGGVDLRGLQAPLEGGFPAPLRPLVRPLIQQVLAQPFPLIVRAVGSEIRIGGTPQEPLKEESVSAYELAYTGTFGGKTTLGLALYINDTDDNVNFTTLAATADPYTPANPPPGWNQRFAPLAPFLGPNAGATVLAAMAQARVFLPRTAFTYLNLGPIRNRGLEFSLDHAVNSEWSLSASYSLQDDPEAKDVDLKQLLGTQVRPFPAAELAFPPRHRVNAALAWNTKRFLGSVSYNYVARALWSDVLTPNLHGFTDSFNMVNATFGVKFADGKVTAAIKGNNLLNEDILQHIFGDVIKRSIVAELRVVTR
jgi:outer membrane receptor protein involved in Fe transport